MNLGQVIGELMRAADVSRVGEAPLSVDRPLPELATWKKAGQGRLREAIIEALRGSSLTSPELYVAVGGNSTSIAAALPKLVERGLIQRTGKRKHYRYTVPA